MELTDRTEGVGMKRTEVIHHDDGYWGVYDHDTLVFLGDRDTAMMVAREVDEQWESGNGDENDDLPAGRYLEAPEL